MYAHMFFTTKLDQVNVADSAFLIFECWTHRMNQTHGAHQTHGATLSEVSVEYPIHMDYEGESTQALERVFCRHSFKLFGKAGSKCQTAYFLTPVSPGQPQCGT